jgi:NADH-quinone oxidoreductase subunit A
MDGGLGGMDPALAVLIHAVAAIATVAAVLLVSALLRDKSINDAGIYESGAPSAAAVVAPVPARYFQIAAFFVIFDFEAAVLFTWAMAAREAGGAGLVSAAIFIGVLLAALAYLRADGALDIGARSEGGAA